MKNMRNGRLYRVTGADSETGQDVEINVEAHDEADAARAANRQGVFVSGCVAAGADGSNWAGPAPEAPPAAGAPGAKAGPPAMTFAEAVAKDPVIQMLVRAHPELARPVKRLNAEDRAYLSALAEEQMGISYRHASRVAELMKNHGNLK